MKKKIITIFTILILTFSVKVNAKTTEKLNLFYEENLYYTMRGNNFYMSYPFPFYTLDNKVVYCIEPGKNITSLDYIGEEDFTYSPYSEEINKKLELIGHYGYEYPGHNTVKYRTATQVLMWETTSDKIIELWSEQYGNGYSISIEKEKQEIMNLVNNHYLKPSFNDNNYEINYNDSLLLKDDFNTLSNYIVKDDGGNLVTIKDNKILIIPKKLGKSTITLLKKKYDNEVTVFFMGSDGISQKMAKFRASDEVESQINITTYGARIKLQKVDFETNKPINKQGIKFQIKNNQTDEFICENSTCIFTTDTNGTFTLKEPLLGSYSIYELLDQSFDNYIYNAEPLNITIDENTILNDYTYEVDFPNKRVKGKIIINKQGEKLNDDYSYSKIPLENVKYGLYANEDIYLFEEIKYQKDDLITELITDETGQAIIEGLELGKYYIKELESSNDNLLDETTYEFELKYQDKYSEVVTKTFDFENYLPKGKIEFIKLDSKTNEPIKDTLIEIYYNNSLYYQGYTDSLGKIELKDMPLGDYTLIEKESALNYLNNNEEINFSITKDNQTIKLSMSNDLIVQVPNTYLYNYNLANILGFILIIIGSGGLIYDKKK